MSSMMKKLRRPEDRGRRQSTTKSFRPIKIFARFFDQSKNLRALSLSLSLSLCRVLYHPIKNRFGHLGDDTMLLL